MPTIQEALELELEFVSALLRRSRAQHGTTFYHRKMSQLVSVLRNGQFVFVTKVVETMQYLASKLESDAYRTYNNSSVQGVKGSTSATMAFKTECIGEKWFYDSITASSSESCSSLLQLPNKTLCSTLRWLSTLHKQGKFQEVTSRMHVTMHSIFLETSRGFFLPLLSVAAASLARLHSIVMIVARQSLLALLHVREKMLSIFQHISTTTRQEERQLTIVIPQPMARYVTDNDSTNVVTWSNLQHLVNTTCGWLSYDVDLPKYMEVTPMHYEKFLSTLMKKTLDARLHKQNDTLQSRYQGSSTQQERKNLTVEDKKRKRHRLSSHSNNNCEVSGDNDSHDEDIGDHIEFQPEQKSDVKVQVSQFSPSASSTKFVDHTLKDFDTRHLQDTNSIILSTLRTNNQKEEKGESSRKKKKYGESDENKPMKKRRQQKKVSRSGMSVIDEIFSFSTSKMKKK